jgi:VIT1/CCC1 family predicted Fe2+/Mn2+ transporter
MYGEGVALSTMDRSFVYAPCGVDNPGVVAFHRAGMKETFNTARDPRRQSRIRSHWEAPMPVTPHVEQHFSGSRVVRDVVIGMSDGLTVPFALAAGLSGAVDSSRVVVMAGLAEVAAGSIAMGLGGYLAALGDAEHYASERAREEREVVEKPDAEVAEVEKVFGEYGLEPAEYAPVVRAFQTRPDAWVEFMMRHELGLDRPEPRQAPRSAGTIAAAYVIGGLIPLTPYFFSATTAGALTTSVVVIVLALAVFGFVKGRYTTGRSVRSAWQTMAIGGLAAAAAYSLARLFA